MKTTSIVKISNFLRTVKIGDVCQVVPRKRIDDRYKQIGYLYNISGKTWFEHSRQNKIILVLDNCSSKIEEKYELPRFDHDKNTMTISFPSIVQAYSEDLNIIIHSSFIKVLYEDQICLIHAGWLEKIKSLNVY